MARPPSKGRQKIAMKKIEDKTHLGVTFTKRRNGLFKKANELVSLCDAELAIITYSPGNKIYSFGHPNVYSVLNRFIDNGKKPRGNNNGQVNRVMTDSQKAKIVALNAQLKQAEKQVELERRIAKALKDQQCALQGTTLATMPREKLTYSQRLELRNMIGELQQRLKLDVPHNVGDDVNVSLENNSPPSIGTQGFVPNNLGVISGSNPNHYGLNFGPWNWKI